MILSLNRLFIDPTPFERESFEFPSSRAPAIHSVPPSPRRRPARRDAGGRHACPICFGQQICCPKVGGITSNAWNQLSIRVSNGRMLNKNIHTNCERIGEFIEVILSILPRWMTLDLTPKSGEEWQRRLASTAIAQFNHNNAFEIKYQI
jgi:hypothetical protein